MASDDQEGITLDCASCLIALAFAVEALVNYVGSMKVRKWKERDSAPKKVEEIARALGLAVSPEVEPFASIELLRNIRNRLAHGTPVYVHNATARSRDELDDATRAPWEQHCTPAEVETLYQQVIELRNTLFKKAKIPLAQSFSSAFGAFDRGNVTRSSS
ncbi:hypothetical protein [Ralstonia pseudosolanacearum]|uniref:hypothetical protein n=1 Tax=Ralstonia pseudosolanacearum TaxID=1310165 RepID=UPI003CFAC37D